MADARAISPGLFETLGVRLVEGRFFTVEDTNPDDYVVIIDDRLADRLWPGRSAVGRTLFVRQGKEKAMVVGVVRHLRHRSLVDDLSPQLYLPWAVAQRNPAAFVLGTDLADPTMLSEQVRAAVSGIDSRLPIYEVRAMRDYIETARSTRRFTVLLAAVFALTALALTVVGIYGVLAYAVAHRRHEFGVRRALGASTSQITVVVLREGVTFGLIGCACGLIVAAMAGRFLETQLYAVHPRDPISFSAAIVLILAASIIGCWIPAYRAASASPMEGLRTD